jgi:5,10-methylenetetrahydromethanopterin reductase
LAGEVADGVVLSYVVSVDHIRNAIARVEAGAQRAGRALGETDRAELIVCPLSNEGPDAAKAEAKKLVAYCLATEPHIMKAGKVSTHLPAEAQSVVGCR